MSRSTRLIKALRLSCNGLCVLILTACATTAPVVPASEIPGQQVTFTTPQEATTALKAAVSATDLVALTAIFGHESSELLSSGDDVADRNALADFSKAMSEGVQVVPMNNIPSDVQAQQVATLLVGKSGWPFPIPLIEESNRWHFDTAIGKQEILNRRIGENELKVLGLAREYVNAQIEYYARDRNGDGLPEYAQKFFSTPGTQDGLYWKSAEGQPLSPMGPLVAAASFDGYMKPSGPVPQAFYGYYFRILTGQSKNARGGAMNYVRGGAMTDGFALLAIPAEWDRSGRMSFLVGPDGVIYQRDLGPDTAGKARLITSFDPDWKWEPV